MHESSNGDRPEVQGEANTCERDSCVNNNQQHKTKQPAPREDDLRSKTDREPIAQTDFKQQHCAFVSIAIKICEEAHQNGRVRFIALHTQCHADRHVHMSTQQHAHTQPQHRTCAITSNWMSPSPMICAGGFDRVKNACQVAALAVRMACGFALGIDNCNTEQTHTHTQMKINEKQVSARALCFVRVVLLYLQIGDALANVHAENLFAVGLLRLGLHCTRTGHDTIIKVSDQEGQRPTPTETWNSKKKSATGQIADLQE